VHLTFCSRQAAQVDLTRKLNSLDLARRPFATFFCSQLSKRGSPFLRCSSLGDLGTVDRTDRGGADDVLANGDVVIGEVVEGRAAGESSRGRRTDGVRSVLTNDLSARPEPTSRGSCDTSIAQESRVGPAHVLLP